MVARGTVLIISTGGGLRGKPRPAVVVQESRFDFDKTIIVVPFTSHETEDDQTMPLIHPDKDNGLQQASRLMTHRIGAIPKSDMGQIVGYLSEEDQQVVDLALRAVLGL